MCVESFDGFRRGDRLRRFALILLVAGVAVLVGAPEVMAGQEEDPYRQIVDNETEGSFEADDSWGTSAYGRGVKENNYRFARPTQDAADAPTNAQFRVEIPEAGNYAVYARWPNVKGGNDAAQVGVTEEPPSGDDGLIGALTLYDTSLREKQDKIKQGLPQLKEQADKARAVVRKYVPANALHGTPLENTTFNPDPRRWGKREKEKRRSSWWRRWLGGELTHRGWVFSGPAALYCKCTSKGLTLKARATIVLQSFCQTISAASRTRSEINFLKHLTASASLGTALPQRAGQAARWDAVFSSSAGWFAAGSPRYP